MEVVFEDNRQKMGPRAGTIIAADRGLSPTDRPRFRNLPIPPCSDLNVSTILAEEKE